MITIEERGAFREGKSKFNRFKFGRGSNQESQNPTVFSMRKTSALDHLPLIGVAIY